MPVSLYCMYGVQDHIFKLTADVVTVSYIKRLVGYNKYLEVMPITGGYIEELHGSYIVI